MRLRKANPEESEVLSNIANESEAYWGEDDDYMNLFRQFYSVTEEMIKEDLVYVLENDKSIVGFFAILKKHDVSELELFYVEKSLIGKGFGTLLWSHMIRVCKEQGISKIELVGSNDVAEFYKKCGAVEIGKVESTLKAGRIVVKFMCEIESCLIED